VQHSIPFTRRIFFVLTIVAALFLSDPVQSFANEGLGIKMNGAAGATVINGVSYQYFSFRPDISIGKFGIGLDLSLYFDADGNIREEDWNEASDAVEKIYYVRWGQPGDPFFIRAGALSPVTLGYGLMMRRYTNAIEWPSVRRIGMQTEIHTGDLGIEALIGNFRELDTPGLVAGRVTLDVQLMIPLRVGANFIYDGNQYLGAPDEDGDAVPDRVDLFPGKDDYGHRDEILQLGLTSSQLQALIDMGDLPDINNMPGRISDSTNSVTEIGIDVGVPIIKGESMSLWVYAQGAQIVDYGRGYTVPGVVFTWGPFHAGVEYRIFEAKFMADYFDMAYETERVFWNDTLGGTGAYQTRSSTLENLPSANGIWADAGATIINMIEIYGSYQQMSYGGGHPGKSLYASASLKKGLIPKVSVAEAYFQQPNADKVFSTDSDGTVLGYKIGYEIGQGVSMIYDNKTIYHNGKPTRIMTVETALSF
jgi:hypothetical protein